MFRDLLFHSCGFFWAKLYRVLFIRAALILNELSMVNILLFKHLKAVLNANKRPCQQNNRLHDNIKIMLIVTLKQESPRAVFANLNIKFFLVD